MKPQVKKALNKLYQSKGSLTPSSVLAAAQKPKSPLHDCFEWDNTKAGHEYRLWQARKLIKTVRVTVGDTEERVINVPSISSGEGEYKPGSIIAQNIDEYTRAYEQAVKKAASAQSAVEELKNFVTEDDYKISFITVALDAMATARSALEKM